MKIHRLSTIICFVLSVCSIILSLFCKALLQSILLNIFAGAFLSFLLSLTAYHIEKTTTIGLITYYCSKYTMEIANLIPLIIGIENDRYNNDWNDIKSKLVNNTEVHYSILKLLSIHDERLLQIKGYYPFCRKNKKNLEIHKLICLLAKINGAIQYCNLAYNLEHNPTYKLETNIIDFDEETFKNQVDIILQSNNNRVYQNFLKLYENVYQRFPSKSIYNTDWEEKCS